MISKLKDVHYRFINLITITSLIVISIVLLEDNIELPSFLFFTAACVLGAYSIWLWISNKKRKSKRQKSERVTEIIVLSIATCIISIIGVIETYQNYLSTTILLAEVFTFSAAIGYLEKYKNRRLSQLIQSRKRYIIGTIICLFTFTLLFILLAYESEEVINFIGVCFFLFLILFGIKWFFKQVKSIINLKNEKAKTELLHLQNQVNPHFFFNVLNNLYGTVGKDPKQAQDIILKLSDMMRYSIYNGQKEKVTIKEEIDHLKNYIDLNQMRYHKIVNIDFDINIKDTSLKIVPLLYLMLLENAFKHGVEKLRNEAYVKIKIEKIQNAIIFTVTNNYDKESKVQTKGIGLKNLKRRLELAYPENHKLSISDKNGTYKAILKLQIL